MLTLPKAQRVLAFQVEGEPGQYEIPYPGGLGLTYSRRLAKLQGVTDPEAMGEKFMDLLVDVLDEYAPGVADKLTADAALVLMREWAGDENLGE